jgi:hypothetical protein
MSDDEGISIDSSASEAEGDEKESEVVPEELCKLCGKYANSMTQNLLECGCCVHNQCMEKWLNIFLDCPVCNVLSFNKAFVPANNMFYCPIQGCKARLGIAKWKEHMLGSHRVFTCVRCKHNYMAHNKKVHKRLDCMKRDEMVMCPADRCGSHLPLELANLAYGDPSVLRKHHGCKSLIPCASCPRLFLEQASLLRHYQKDACDSYSLSDEDEEHAGGRRRRTKRKRLAAVEAGQRIDLAKKKEARGDFGKKNRASDVGAKFFRDVMNGGSK